MKKIIISLAAVAAFSTAALAERNYDLENKPFDAYTNSMQSMKKDTSVAPLVIVQSKKAMMNNYDNNIRDNIGRSIQ
jgi:hypothetical protein